MFIQVIAKFLIDDGVKPLMMYTFATTPPVINFGEWTFLRTFLGGRFSKTGEYGRKKDIFHEIKVTVVMKLV